MEYSIPNPSYTSRETDTFLFTIRFVPVNLQVGAANVIALMWNTYMSWVTHKEVVPVMVEEKENGGKKKK
jgi:hypothetical protein